MHSLLSRRRLTPHLLLMVLLVTAWPSDGLSAQQAGIEVGTVPPAVEVLDLDGAPVALQELLAGGTAAILEFWATWCPLCRDLEPQFAELEEDYGAALRVIRVGVPDNQSREQQRRYVERRGLGGIHLFDAEGAATRAFRVPHTSYVVIVDEDGRVAYTGVGRDQDLPAAVRRVLGAPEDGSS